MTFDAPATIISLLALIASGAISVVVKMLWDTVQGIKHENDKLSTRVNAMEVSLARINYFETTLRSINEGISRLENRFEEAEKEAIRIRTTYIPRIQNLEEHYKEIIAALKKLERLNDIVGK